MKQLSSIVGPQQDGPRFFDFIFRNKENRRWGLLALGLSIIGWAFFKWVYPNPNLVLDSYCLLRGAIYNSNVEIWPVGYSKFLILLGFISHSPLLLVWVQYMGMVLACLFFFFTLLYIFNPGKWVKWSMFVFLFINPLFYYINNFVLTDGLYTTLSVAWFTLLIWVVFRPKDYMIWVHAALLLALFSIRYNALFYPLVAAVAFFLSGFRLWKKIVAVALAAGLVVAFVQFTSNEMERETGTRGFTVFSAWKIANNALYAYGHYYKEDTRPAPAEFGPLDTLIRRSFDANGVDNMFDYNSTTFGSMYMFHPYSPLTTYMSWKLDEPCAFITLKQSMPMSPLYGAYGTYLVKRNPWAFTQWFLLPNLQRHFLPPMESYGNAAPFRIFKSRLRTLGLSWFGNVTSLDCRSFGLNLRDILLIPAMPVACLVQLVFWLSAIGVWYAKFYKQASPLYNRLSLLVLALAVIEFGFSITSAGIVMRYLLFILSVQLCFTLIMGEHLVKMEKIRKLFKEPAAASSESKDYADSPHIAQS